MIRLSFVGDIFPANMLYRNDKGLATQFLSHRGTVWEKPLKEMFKGDDFVIGNLESPISHDEAASSREIFLGCADFLRFLREAGFNVLNIANNHILEHGINGFSKTIQAIRDHEIIPFGYEDRGTSNVVILEKEGMRIGLAGFNGVHDIQEPNTYAVLNKNNIDEALGGMQGCDFRMISLHWGHEYLTYPSNEQVSFARSLIDAGADVIIGHHAHRIQPVERYKNGVIFYNLGNFMFDSAWSEFIMLGMVAKLTFIKGKPVQYSSEPVYRNRENLFVPYSQKKFDRLLKQASGKIGNAVNYAREVKKIRSLSRARMLMHNLREVPKMSPRARKLFLSRFSGKLKKGLSK